MTNKEFHIESLPEAVFRFGKVNPIALLSIRTQVDFDDYKKFSVLSTFVLEHCEVKVGETWQPVKVVDREVYMPLGIEENINALNELVETYLREVVLPTFHVSEG